MHNSDYILKNFCPEPVAKYKHKMADKKCAITVSNFYQCGFTVIIILCGDIAQNPGPIKHPCGLCHISIRNNQRAIQCEDCFFWHRIKCINMSIKEYNDLSNSWESWFCRTCILPSFTDSFFDMSLNENNEKTADCGYLPYYSSTSTSSGVNRNKSDKHVFEDLCKLRQGNATDLICGYLNINIYAINMNILKIYSNVIWSIYCSYPGLKLTSHSQMQCSWLTIFLCGDLIEINMGRNYCIFAFRSSRRSKEADIILSPRIGARGYWINIWRTEMVFQWQL